MSRRNGYLVVVMMLLLPAGVAAQPKPDVYVSSLKVSLLDRTATYTATVCNKGAATTKTFTVELFYNRVNAPTCTGHNENAQATVSGLGAGACVTKTFVYKAAAGGANTAWALADGDCHLAETNESNNAAKSAYTVAKPDLYVLGLKVAVADRTATYTATVCNKGTTALGPWVVELFYNRATAPVCTEHAENAQLTHQGLGAGACVTKVFTYKAAAVGANTAWALADGDCHRDEAD